MKNIVDYAGYMLEYVRTLRYIRILQHLGGERDRGYRCLQLVRHVVDKVVFHLG